MDGVRHTPEGIRGWDNKVLTNKTAEWIESSIRGYLHCSACKDVYILAEWLQDGKWKFCPNCGRKMKTRGQKQHEEY